MSLGRVTRVVVFGACFAALAFSSVGCHVRQQMPSRRFAKEYKPVPEGPLTFAPDVEQATYNRMAMDGLPAMVQVNFRRDYPEAAITAVEQIPTGAGLMLYRVAFMDDGVAGCATYRAGGREMNPPGPEYIIRRDDSGRPPAKYAPSTRPTVRTEIEILAPAAGQ